MDVSSPTPQRVLERLGQLIARCAASERDDAARVSLTSLARDCYEEYPAISEEAIATLSRDTELGVRRAAASSLADLLVHLDGLSRLRTTINWATTSDRHQRLAVATALGDSGRGLGIAALLDQLVQDELPEVRRAACLSCGRQIERSSAVFAELLAICALDPVESIRSAALESLRRAAGAPAGHHAREALDELAGSDDTGPAEG